MAERPDPFYVVKDEVIKSLAQANTEYEAWKSDVLGKSANVKTAETALKQTIRNIEWDLEDLQVCITYKETVFLSPVYHKPFSNFEWKRKRTNHRDTPWSTCFKYRSGHPAILFMA
ncbi:unnamed protein product [Dibothriocephalus latus]|uniref:Syntaxin 6/10/61 N-terminal domain-containing protein n=1 Tax=Dibothriocephalus latus TaxID=60516 RepID=A0A3P7LHW1_DIBLA|nr:unnamed protein product [Dibothriocephalus latus]